MIYLAYIRQVIPQWSGALSPGIICNFRRLIMETYIYKCPVCGYAHQVPAYWVSFSPEPEMEHEHPDFSKGEMCENRILKLMSESESNS